MSKIIRLPAELCNQIAAGEVVERPASVVKELVENSMDAQATRIQVDIGAGGLSLIRITDDGVGMEEQDARLAVERHATSKIAVFDDLMQLQTFGFRGEALPSIASVSRFALRTRTHDADSGVEVTTDGGSELKVSPFGLAPGTIVEVRDLFFNVPARRKFLKSVTTESANIGQMLEALALAAPELTFVFNRDGRKAKQWLRAQSRKQRVLDIHPDEKLALVTGQRGPLELEAYLSPPELARSGAVGLTFLINGRVVRDRLLARVVAQAYGSVLESGRYPTGVVYLDIDPKLVDVNVHPQKAEVRFADGKAVQDAVFQLVSEGLAGAFGLAPPTRMYPAHRPAPAPVMPPPMPPALRRTEPLDVPAPPASERPLPPPMPREQPVEAPAVQASSVHASPPVDPWGLTPPEPVPAAAPTVQVALPLAPSMERKPAEPSQVEQAPALESQVEQVPPLALLVPPSTRYSSLHYLAQLRNLYLLCEGADGLVIIDQHAAAERVTFARLRAAYRSRSVASQRLLLPVTISIDAAEAAFLEESSEDISATGLELRVVGPSRAAVTAVPQIVSRADPERLARDLLDETSRVGGRKFSQAVDLVLATMACHGSLRAGEPITAEQAKSLLQAMDQVDYAGHCPHGRPLVMQIRFDELERGVGRR